MTIVFRNIVINQMNTSSVGVTLKNIVDLLLCEKNRDERSTNIMNELNKKNAWEETKRKEFCSKRADTRRYLSKLIAGKEIPIHTAKVYGQDVKIMKNRKIYIKWARKLSEMNECSRRG